MSWELVIGEESHFPLSTNELERAVEYRCTNKPLNNCQNRDLKASIHGSQVFTFYVPGFMAEVPKRSCRAPLRRFLARAENRSVATAGRVVEGAGRAEYKPI